MSNSVVPVLGLRSLLVYAAIVIPVAGVGGVQLSVPSTVVMPPGLTSCRRFWPLSETMRRHQRQG